MTRLLLILALLLGLASPAVAQERGVADPRAFVAETYARYQAGPNVPPPDQGFAYSPRLKSLFDAYEAWTLAVSHMLMSGSSQVAPAA